MSQLAALTWLALSAIGIPISARAIWRGTRRYRTSDDPVARAVHLSELAIGALFFIVFSLAVTTALVSIYILPEVATHIEASAREYARNRSEFLRWLLVGQKAIELGIVFIPEILDRHLTNLAEPASEAESEADGPPRSHAGS